MARLGAGKGWVGCGECNRRGGRSLGLSSGCGHRAEPSADSGVGLAFLLFFLSGVPAGRNLGALEPVMGSDLGSVTLRMAWASPLACRSPFVLGMAVIRPAQVMQGGRRRCLENA